MTIAGAEQYEPYQYEVNQGEVEGGRYPLDWVIWNGALGLVDTAQLDRIEQHPGGPRGWLGEPYDMVGPLCLKTLEADGIVEFAACIVMSRHRWQADQEQLRRASLAHRRAAQARAQAQAQARSSSEPGNTESLHRSRLELPMVGALTPNTIKAAYRRLAQKHHPDRGGHQAVFVQITQAKEALMTIYAA